MRNKLQIILILFFFSLSCVYYNTFYNAKRSFKEGENAQKRSAPGAKSSTAEAKYEEAIKKASKVLTFHPKSKWADDALFLIGRSYYNMEEYAKAERKFKELMVSFPKSKLAGESRYYVSLCQYKSGNEEEAVQSLQSVVESDKADKKKRAEAAFMMGEIYSGRQEYDDAIASYRNVVENYEKDTLAPVAQLRIGESFWLKKDYAQAKEAFSQVEKYHPKPEDLFQSKFKSGECCYSLGEFEEGIDVFTRLSKEIGDSEKLPAVKLKIVEGILLSGNTDEAIKEYDDIIKDYAKTEHSARALYQLGLIHQEKFGDLKKAKEMFDSCKIESPRSEIAQEALSKSANISKVEEYQKELSEAETEKHGRALFLLAELYLTQMNQPDSALAEYLALANNYPESEYAAQSLYAAAWILDNIKKDAAQAEELYQRILEEYPATDYSEPAADFLGLSHESIQVDTPEREYIEAERMLLEYENVDSALLLYNTIIEQFPHSSYAGEAAYAIAWITEHYANPGDSTVALAYQKVIDGYPNSKHADAARIRLGQAPVKQALPPPSPEQEELAGGQPGDTVQVDTTSSSGPSTPMAPNPLKAGEFVYPESEIESGVEGNVVVKIMIDFEGKVMDAVIVNKTDNYWIDEAAKKAAMETTFDPDSIDVMDLGGWFLYDVEVRAPEVEDNLTDQSGMEQ